MSMEERKWVKVKQDNTYWEWTEDKQAIKILWIIETEEGTFYQKFKTIKIGENNNDSGKVDFRSQP